MASTAISDIIDPQVLSDQISAKFPDKLVLGTPGLVDVDSEFPLGAPGTKFTIPFWKRISAFGDMTEGTALTPSKIQALSESATVLRGGGAFEVYDTAQLVSKSDPVGEIAGQIARRAAEYIDAKLVSQVAHTPNVFDQTNATVQTNANGIFDEKVAITAMVNTMGDNYGRMLRRCDCDALPCAGGVADNGSHPEPVPVCDERVADRHDPSPERSAGVGFGFGDHRCRVHQNGV